MKKYEVTLLIDACNNITVEADSPEEAADMAYDSDESNPRLCHHCSSDLQVGDCTAAIVYQDDDEVFNDSLQSEYESEAKKYKAFIAKIAKQQGPLADEARELLN